jgi:CRP-like cAMP-binding protein
VSRTELVDQAAAAVSRGRYRKALAAYDKLERLEPADGAWSRRAGEMLRHLGEVDDALVRFAIAVDKYAQAGFLVKAIAVCKLILRIEPSHPAIIERLAALTDEKLAGTRPTRAPVRAAAPRRKTPPTLPPGEPLEAVRLRDTVPGAEPRRGEPRISLIPIDTSDFDDALAELGGVDVASNSLGALTASPLFAGLAAASLQTLVDRVELRELAAGEAVFRQGDVGAEMYVIAEGEVRVIARTDDGGDVELGRLGEGDFFGEIALVADVPRSATVKAAVPTQLLVLGRGAISELLDRSPSVLSLLLRFLRDRLLDRLTKTHPLLAPFVEAERAEITGQFELIEVDASTALVKQGERARGMFVLLAGTASVDLRTDDGAVRHLADLELGAVFGEMSLLTREPAVATVTTTSKVFAVVLPAEAFRELIMTHPQVLVYINELVEHRRRLLEGADYQRWQLELL